MTHLRQAAPERRTLLFCLVYAALALFTAFYPAFFGELPVPAGGAHFLLPDAGRIVQRNELDDVPTEFLPWSKAVAQAYRAGRFPLRLAANGCGSALWANPQAQAVTPTTLFNLVMPESWASAAAAAVKLGLAASGAFLFLRALGASAAAAGWAGLAYGFAIHMTCWMHFPHTWPAGVFPWTLLAFLRLARGAPNAFFPAVFAVLALLLGGYPEGEFYVALATAAVFAAALIHARAGARQTLARCAEAAAASLLALGLSAAYTLPASRALAGGERARQTDRGTLSNASVASVASAAAAPLTASDFVRPPTYWDVSRFWVVPEAQGNPRDGDKFGPYSFAGRASGYSGILIVAFALATFLWRRAPPPVAWARGGLVFLALYVLWYPPLSQFLQSTPGIRQVAVRLTTNRANTIAVLLLVLLAAFELDRIRAGGRTLATRVGIALAFLAVLVTSIAYLRALDRPPISAWRMVSFVLPAILLISVFVLLSLHRGSKAIRGAPLAVLLFLATGMDLVRIGARFNPGTRPADYFPVTPFVSELQRSAEGGRIAGSTPYLTGVAFLYGLEDVRVHDPVAFADYVDVLVATTGYVGPGEYMPRVARLDAPFLAFLNVRARFGEAPRVLAVSSPPQAAIFPQHLIGARDIADLLERMSRETDFEQDAFAVGADENFAGTAMLVSFEKPRPEFLRLRVRSDAPRLLVVAESDDGGWSAEADGQPLPTLSVNGAFLGIRIPAGETRIVCRYVPPGFRQGLALSGLTAAFVLVLAGRRRGAGRPARRRGARSSARSSVGEATPPEPPDRARRADQPGA